MHEREKRDPAPREGFRSDPITGQYIGLNETGKAWVRRKLGVASDVNISEDGTVLSAGDGSLYVDLNTGKSSTLADSQEGLAKVADALIAIRSKHGARLQKPFIKLHHCPVLNIPIPTAVLCVSIATLLVTGYIAWQQWQTGKNKFRLDLFDRRFPVFEAAMKLVWIAGRKGDISDRELTEFSVATKGVQFLFDRKVQDYCDKLAEEAIRLHLAYELQNLPVEVAPVNSAEHKKHIEAWEKRVEWFNEQVGEIPKLFGPFLRVRG